MEIFIGSRISKFLLPAQLYDNFKLINNTCQAACHGKTEHGILVKLKKRAKLLSSYLPVSPSRVLRAPGTSPYHLVPKHFRTTWSRPKQSFLRPALPMAPTRDENARDKRSVLRPNPATFSRNFTLYMTTTHAFLRKRCLNHNVLYNPLVPSVRYDEMRDDNAKDKQI